MKFVIDQFFEENEVIPIKAMNSLRKKKKYNLNDRQNSLMDLLWQWKIQMYCILYLLLTIFFHNDLIKWRGREETTQYAYMDLTDELSILKHNPKYSKCSTIVRFIF